MARLIAFGDSYTTGLNKPDGERYYVKPYIQFVADAFDLELVNEAVDGNSNPVIATNVLNFKFEPDDKIFICWSGLTRDFEWSTTPLGFVKPRFSNNRRHRNPHHCFFMSNLAIRATENFLTKNNLNYIMASAFVIPDWLEVETWTNWFTPTLKDICTKELLEKCLHPNQEGHRKIANYIMEYVDGTLFMGRKIPSDKN